MVAAFLLQKIGYRCLSFQKFECEGVEEIGFSEKSQLKEKVKELMYNKYDYKIIRR